MAELGDSVLFTYGAPFVGVLLLSVGIAAAVPGAYALLQNPDTCGTPTISVEGAERTQERFDGDPPVTIARFDFESLTEAEQMGFEEALNDAVGEAEVSGEFPRYAAFANGSLVDYQGADHFVRVVADNPCYAVSSLQFPLGVFAVALGIIGILTPPGYQKLIELEEGLTED